MKPRRTHRLRDMAREREGFRARALSAFVIVLCCFAVLIWRFVHLQVVQHEEYTTRSESNRVKIIPRPSNRGLILDRRGVVLADNWPAYRLEIIPEQVRDLSDTLERLADIIELEEDDLEKFQEIRRARHSFQSIPLRLQLEEVEVARFSVNRHSFPGVNVVAYQTRQYPFGAEFAHVIGYVGRLDRADLDRVDASEYVATTHIGKSGVERYYESHLHGQVGRQQVETNAQGRVIDVLKSEPQRSGMNLHLTIDAALQQASIDALGDYNGAVVALDPATGEVLALVSAPSYDPNLFVNGISSRDYRSLIDSPDQPLFNRALQGGYEPGSTLKPFMALAGLELGEIDASTTVNSIGYYQLPDQERRYHDWRPGGHGPVDVVEALAQSVNVFFYQLAVDLTIDRIHDYLDDFGFGEPTGLDLNGEISGVLPSRQWKRTRRNLPWFPGETVILGIGQGFMVTTPMQLANATAAMANRGRMVQPHLLRAIENPLSGAVQYPEYPSTSVPVVDAENWQLVIEGMERVVHGVRGTARAIAVDDPPFRIAGKSGTAQVYGLKEGEKYDADEVAEHLRDHALFIAFAPVEAPTIALAVVAEHGGGGSSVAAPIARKVIDAWLKEPVADDQVVGYHLPQVQLRRYTP